MGHFFITIWIGIVGFWEAFKDQLWFIPIGLAVAMALGFLLNWITKPDKDEDDQAD